VYLTTHSPLYYANQNYVGKGSAYMCVFEVAARSLKARALFPDEDYINELASIGKLSRPWVELPRSTEEDPCLDPRAYPNQAAHSIRELGNCSVEGPLEMDSVERMLLVSPNDGIRSWLEVRNGITIDGAQSIKSYHGALLNPYFEGRVPDAGVLCDVMPSANDDSLEAFSTATLNIAAARNGLAVVVRPDHGWTLEVLLAWYDAFNSINRRR
jgi:hypothetical protein